MFWASLKILQKLDFRLVEPNSRSVEKGRTSLPFLQPAELQNLKQPYLSIA